MITKLAKVQLIAFAIVGIVALVYAGAKVRRLDKLSGLGQYDVTVQMDKSSGGIFKNAEVTYRGTPVGSVGDLELTPEGVDVTLKLNKSAPKVPATAYAVIANRSAVGEQFVDLQPTSSSGPYLEGRLGDPAGTHVDPAADREHPELGDQVRRGDSARRLPHRGHRTR